MMDKLWLRWIPYIGLMLALAACSVQSPSELAPTAAAADVSAAEDPARLSWPEVESSARGVTVNFFMWGGDDNINRYVNEYVAPQVLAQYGITLRQTPVNDIVETVNKLLGEKTEGKLSDGTIDLIWINGENFRTMRQGELLYGPWAENLPNAQYVPWAEPSIANDFGYPVDAYEAPWGRAQFVMIYDSARVADPPKSFADLLEWTQTHPGRFTYPAPPDFTGSVFVRHGFYEVSSGYERLIGPFDETVYADNAGAAWEYFNQLEPYLWREGETYPQTIDQLNQLFANGEADFTMSYNPAFASGAIARGVFPDSVRTYLFDAGTIANTHYVAIPFNATNKAAAMVVANFLQSPQAQIEKAKPEVWGDLPVMAVESLPESDRELLAAIPQGVATLTAEELAANALPELQADWLTRIEEDWQTEVLKP